jgi:hypothetical protein
MTKYWWRYWCLPLRIPQGPHTELESAYKELRLDIITPPARKRPANQWILNKSRKIIDKWVTLRRMGNLPLTVPRQIGHEIKSSLTADCTQCAANAALTIESHLSNRAPKEV